jgi:hypothetical protein
LDLEELGCSERNFMKGHEKQQQTALLAYQFWMDRGCPVGSPAEDWFRAERALHSRQSEEVAADAAEEAPADVAGRSS